MTISIFSAFFGLTGLICNRLFPALGYITLIPAIAAGMIVSVVLMRLSSWAFEKCNVSSNAKTEDLVGQIAQVCVPIKEGRKGEITCDMGSKRYNYPAVAGSFSLPSGSKVIISDFVDGIVTVEPFEDFTLDISTAQPVAKKIEQ
jgi:membrane protein implicated in regulation of membrane protease activity